MAVSVILVLVLLLSSSIYIESCNEAICGSVVSKCLLTKACNCDQEARVCSVNCYGCLGRLFNSCCSCVGMCPAYNESADSLSTKSHVEDFLEGAPDLFNVLTEFTDKYDRWNVTKYPVSNTTQDGIVNNSVTVNCTVVFWMECMSWTKCKNGCLTMGASSYRWFHDGCCECIGQNCVNYGINENRCHSCPFLDDIEYMDENDLEYGEDNYDDYDF